MENNNDTIINYNKSEKNNKQKSNNKLQSNQGAQTSAKGKRAS